jgi:hypothetical protein
MDHLDYLTNRIGPRLAGSENLQIACEWARDKFESFGLSNSHLEKCGEIAVGFNRGISTGYIKFPHTKSLHFTTPFWSAGTDGIRRGRAVMAPEEEEDLVKMHGDFEGAWVLRHPILDPKIYESYMAKWDEMDVNIAGFIIPSKGKMLPAYGNHMIEWEDLPTTPQVILLEEEWQEIKGMLTSGDEVILEFDIRNYFEKGPVPLYNVIADIPGTEFPDEYVIIGAHIDSWDSGTGANDNGTGVTAAIEAARLIMESGVKPMRTIRFILFAGEEVGMYGSRDYVDSHPELMSKISAVLVMDQGTDFIRGILATDAMMEDFEDVFAPVKTLDEEMPFEIARVEHLPRAAACGPGLEGIPQTGGSVVKKGFEVKSSCGGGPIDASQLSGCAIRKDMDTSGSPGERQIVIAGNPGDVDSLLKAMGIDSSSGEKQVTMSLGSSDFAPFLNAGVPGFMWDQSGDVPYTEYIHSQNDTYDMVIVWDSEPRSYAFP